MARKIVVDPAKLTSASQKMDGMVAEYVKQYTLLFTEVEGMGAAWQGKDNVAFVNQIKGFQDDFTRMKEITSEYASFLKTSADRYTATQSNLESSARKLTN
ncbi:WXG100 family type VII secretion target [Paenibacillus sinopodophylli]|uniref:WXG100 family type VII secretion target n=1 Tax=Paenibacillus sinopodophylli TaxID=1837342 RepID=UPI00110D14F4|nr:WXG100 family type VII secretion target [Paenibacillus sinopodophylli]